MSRFTIIHKGESITLTDKQFMEMFFNNRLMVRWGTGGQYGNGSAFVNKVGFKRAELVDEKLTGFINGVK